jgi:hypothetical protein
MKTRINQILLISLFAFFFLAGNVTAKGTEIDLASSLELTMEPALEMEEWMLNDNFLINTEIDCLNIDLEEANNLEEWMTDESFYTYETIEFTDNTETELEVESWMLSADFFRI